MKVRLLPTLMLLFIAGFFSQSALAVENGNTSKGRKLYRQFCLGCHKDFSAAGQLNTRAKTQSQWKRFFRKNRHKNQVEIFSGLSDEELLNIRSYIQDYAADTDASKCGSCWESN